MNKSLILVICAMFTVSCELFSGPKVDLFKKISRENFFGMQGEYKNFDKRLRKNDDSRYEITLYFVSRPSSDEILSDDPAGVSDNSGVGILKANATQDKPWTMDDPGNVKWRYRIVKVSDSTPDYTQAVNAAPAITAASQTVNFGAISLSSQSYERRIEVQYVDGIGNENASWVSIGNFRYNTTTITGVTVWSASYNVDNNSIDVTWTRPDNTPNIEVWVNGNLLPALGTTATTGAPYRITGIPRIDTSGITIGQPVGNIKEYNIKLIAVYTSGKAPAAEFKIWNFGTPGAANSGMSVSNTYPAYEVIDGTSASNSAARTVGLSNITLNNENVKYVLTGNITVSGWTPKGDSSTPFTGKFYGNGKTITVNGNIANVSYTGLFGYVSGANAEIRDLSVNYAGETTAGASAVNTGGLAGRVESGAKIRNIIVSGAPGAVLKHSYTNSSSNIYSRYYGGVVGYMNGTSTAIDKAYGALNLKITSSGYIIDYVGGIVGCFESSGAACLTDCVYAMNTVIDVNSNYYLTAGGITGYMTGGIASSSTQQSLSGCYSRGNLDL